jgi:hypothetical protein
MTSRCPCQHCGGKIEFEAEQFHVGQISECPHCNKQTPLFIGPPERPRFNVDYSKRRFSERDKLLFLSYALAILIPLAGFFTGVYLMAKKEHGHGAACMGISVFCSYIWRAIWLAIIL